VLCGYSGDEAQKKSLLEGLFHFCGSGGGEGCTGGAGGKGIFFSLCEEDKNGKTRKLKLILFPCMEVLLARVEYTVC
jgi:hypothetical protein